MQGHVAQLWAVKPDLFSLALTFTLRDLKEGLIVHIPGWREVVCEGDHWKGGSWSSCKEVASVAIWHWGQSDQIVCFTLLPVYFEPNWWGLILLNGMRSWKMCMGTMLIILLQAAQSSFDCLQVLAYVSRVHGVELPEGAVDHGTLNLEQVRLWYKSFGWFSNAFAYIAL